MQTMSNINTDHYDRWSTARERLMNERPELIEAVNRVRSNTRRGISSRKEDTDAYLEYMELLTMYAPPPVLSAYNVSPEERERRLTETTAAQRRRDAGGH